MYTTINLVDHVPRNGSPVDLQARNGAEWHQLKATNLSAITQPLRVILWQTWASELIKRIQAVGSDPSQRQEAIRLRILTEPDCFKYVRWNPTQRTLEPQEDQAPLTAKEAIDMLQETIVLCKEAGVMTNHHPTRKLVPNMTGAAVTLALILGLREAGPFADVDHSRDSGEQLGSAAGGDNPSPREERPLSTRPSHRAGTPSDAAQLQIKSVPMIAMPTPWCLQYTLDFDSTR